MAAEIVGWCASLVLLATILTQIAKQWRDDTSRGVSSWLYVGQAAASTGFVIYSVAVDSAVFVVTNALMLCAALVGLTIVMRHRRRRASRGSTRRGPAANGKSPRTQGNA